jgi:hypothetical protein
MTYGIFGFLLCKSNFLNGKFLLIVEITRSQSSRALHQDVQQSTRKNSGTNKNSNTLEAFFSTKEAFFILNLKVRIEAIHAMQETSEP